jgi:hypothetical protein
MRRFIKIPPDLFFGLLLSLLAVVAAYTVGDRVFEHMAHLEDEEAFVWQAQVLARGKLTLPSPPESAAFLWPFVVDYEGQRFGKYPLGWPLVLSIGERLNLRDWVNPLLAGLGVWLTFLLGRSVFGSASGLLAAALTVTSPFFLMQSGSLLSHPLGLVLSASFVLAWLVSFTEYGGRTGAPENGAGAPQTGAGAPQTGAGTPLLSEKKKLWASVFAGLALGALAITRPWTAVGVALPFALHGLFLMVRPHRFVERSDRNIRQRLLITGAITLGFACLHLLWQWVATGDPFKNLYTLWWSYDKVGFGPGHGVKATGHTLIKAINHLKQSFRAPGSSTGGFPELFGWKSWSWIFIPFGLLAALRLPRQRRLAALLVAAPFLSLCLVHMAYWVGSYVLGPRYYYEGLFSLTIYCGAGVALLAGWAIPGIKHPEPGSWRARIAIPRSVLVSLLLGGLVLYNLTTYLPQRLEPLRGLYGISRAPMEPFLSEQAQQLTPALVIVHTQKAWVEYGTLLELQSPYLDSPFIFVFGPRLKNEQALARAFPERRIIHYYPDEPDKFYLKPR